ncbi:MAG TPA: hypothetical protein VGQ76_06470 [Thermoanaerobaculia bacterium]|jgi:hypothetical protein|nr:hypothetical protein [Thermoanaerobaculia bacterium]
MIARLNEWLFPTKELRLELGREPGEVISILRARTRARGLRSLFYTGLVGRVDERRVKVRYKMAWVGRAFEDVLDGRFETIADRTYLVGRLRQSLGDRIFFLVWSSFIVLWWALALGLTIRLPEPHMKLAIVILFPPALLAAGVGILRLHQWRARINNARLDAELRDAAATPHLAGEASPGFRVIP